MTKITQNQEQLVSLAYNRSTSSLQAQASTANNADQRALVFSTLSVAAAALVFGSLSADGVTFFASGAAAFFCTAAVFGALSALPGALYGMASKTGELKEHIDNDTPLTNVLLGLCNNNDESLEMNEAAAKRRAHAYRFAVILFILGVLVSLIGFVRF